MVEFFELGDYIKGRNVTEIKSKYLSLLRELTDAPDISDENFLKQIEEIEKIGKIYIGVDNDIIICSGSIVIEPKLIHGGKCVGHIEDIVVISSWRGKGLGYAMLDQLKNYGFNNNCYKIILDCKDDLEQFYKKCHFNKRGIQMSLYT